MKNILMVCLICLVSSCSSLSKNMKKEGELTLRGFKLQESETKEELILKRYSWYQGLTLDFELLMSSIKKDSDFYKAFTLEEQKTLSKCDAVYIAFTYELTGKRLSRGHLLTQLQSVGLNDVVTPDFAKEMRMHPDFSGESLQLYRFHTFCSSEGKLETFINFPGFSSFQIRI